MFDVDTWSAAAAGREDSGGEVAAPTVMVDKDRRLFSTSSDGGRLFSTSA